MGTIKNRWEQTARHVAREDLVTREDIVRNLESQVNSSFPPSPRPARPPDYAPLPPSVLPSTFNALLSREAPCVFTPHSEFRTPHFIRLCTRRKREEVLVLKEKLGRNLQPPGALRP